MARAFVLIHTREGRSEEVLSALRKLERVKVANSVTGPYDIIAIVEGSLADIGEVVIGMGAAAGIARVLTSLVMEDISS